eukprot:6433175-Pyramimonas_sp.AAC.1
MRTSERCHGGVRGVRKATRGGALPRPLGPWWHSLWGHGICRGCAETARGGARERTLGPKVELLMGARSV